MAHRSGRTSTSSLAKLARTSSTVAAASAGWGDGEKRVGGMASVRVIMPLSDLTKSTLVHPGGSSGLPKHPQAFSNFEAFVGGETLPLYTSDADVVAHTVSLQTLTPPGGRPKPAPAPEPEAPATDEEAPAEEGAETEAPVEGEVPPEATAPDATTKTAPREAPAPAP